MKFEFEYIKQEENQLEDLQIEIDELSKKWFKTAKTYNLIDFLKEYIEMKEKFIEELKKLTNKK